MNIKKLFKILLIVIGGICGGLVLMYLGFILFLVLNNKLEPSIVKGNELYPVVISTATAQEEFCFAEVTDFEWDVAFNYWYAYGTGEDLKKKYGLDFEIESLGSEELKRVLFFNKGELVCDMQIHSLYFKIEWPTERFTPETVFKVIPDEHNFIDLMPINTDTVTYNDRYYEKLK